MKQGAMSQPLVTVIVTAYNRAGLLARALDSIVAQSHKNTHIVVVDDGSTDHFEQVIQPYVDLGIEVIRHPVNRGVLAAKNTGLNRIKGEWFTFLDSDDEMTPDALTEMLNVPQRIDRAIDAVTCNCIDSTKGDFSGKGLESDQYLDAETISRQCSGEFWGLTKTCLLGSMRFNERLHGHEDTLWYKINIKTKRYYIHKALRIYHTEGNDRITKLNFRMAGLQKAKLHDIYSAMAEETQYLDYMGMYNPKRMVNRCFQGLIVSIAHGEKQLAGQYATYLCDRGYAVHPVIQFISRHLCNGDMFVGNFSLSVLIYLKMLNGLLKR